MKIRIKDQSIRFRLTQTEVKDLSEKEQITSILQMGSSQFKYTICGSLANNISLQVKDEELTVFLPSTSIQQWALPGQISIIEQVHFDQSPSIGLLIEKDFKCLKDHPGEDESDMFPNPDEGILQC